MVLRALVVLPEEGGILHFADAALSITVMGIVHVL